MKLFYRVIIILCMVLVVLTIPSHAQDELSWDSISKKAENFINVAEPKEINAAPLVNGLANILTTIGVVIVLIGLLVMGIKYMVATPEEAAKLKTKMVGLVLAGVVILGAFGIWRLAGQFFARNYRAISWVIK